MPRCRSNVVYKGALQGDGAHTVWVGDVLIRAAAEGTDTYELNRNLVLTEGARADSVPNLEIETGEIVGAGHASATGRFDDEQLFYLQARGIPETEARRLVVRGFFNELIQRIGVPDVQERLVAAIESELASSMAGIAPGVDAEARAPIPARGRGDRNVGRHHLGRHVGQVAARLSELPDVGAVRMVVAGVPVAVVRARTATVHAIGDTARTPRSRCPTARSTTARIECWLHGSRFDLRTGPPTALPAIRPVPVYPVRIDGDDVFVDVTKES